MPRRLPVHLLVAAAAALALLATWAPARALAHAQLEGTSPLRGAVLKREPGSVTFRFDEPVEGTFGAVRVYDSAGRRVDRGDAFHPGGRGPLMAVHLKPHLPAGSYTATYRVVSADGHIVSSGFVFSIGHPTASARSVGQLIGGSGTGGVTAVAFGAARAIQYASVALGVGGLLFLLLIWARAAAELDDHGEAWRRARRAWLRRTRRIWLGIALAGVVSAAAGIVLEGADAAGISAWSAFSPDIVRETLSTRFGLIWGVAALAWIAAGLAGGWGLARPERKGAAVAPAVAPLAFVALAPALSGHASTQHPVAVLFPADVIHVLAMSTWLGGLAALLLALPAATRMLPAPDRTRLLAATLARFSPLALGAVALLAASGLLQAYIEVRTPANLVSDPFGVCVLAKIVLLGALICLGAFQRRRSVPRLRALASRRESAGTAGRQLRAALRGELALIAAVLGVTGALTGLAPSVEAQSGPYSTSGAIGPKQLEMTVDPALVGSNQIHLYILDPETGAPFTGAKEVDVSETLPAKRVGPLRQRASASGPGHYIVSGAPLTLPGTWRVQVTMRVSRFDEYVKTVEVPVR